MLLQKGTLIDIIRSLPNIPIHEEERIWLRDELLNELLLNRPEKCGLLYNIRHRPDGEVVVEPNGRIDTIYNEPVFGFSIKDEESEPVP